MKKNAIEETIVGILLRYPDLLLKNEIEPRWFDTCRKYIVSMQKMLGAGIEIDALSLYENCSGSDLSLLVYFQKELMGSKGNVNSYLGELKKIYIDKGILESLEKSLFDLRNGHKSMDVISDLLNQVNSIKNFEGRKFNYNAKEALKSFIANLEEVYDADGNRGIKLGFSKIDDAIGGLQPTDMMIVGARPGVGKTAFAISVINKICKKGIKVGFFSTEMSVQQVMGRLVSMDAKIDTSRIRDAKIEDDEFPRITASTAKMSNYKLMIYDKPNMTPSSVLLQSRAWKSNDGLDLIIIDYLTRLRPDTSRGNQNLDIGEIVTSIKNMARDLSTPVIVLAQLNRENAGKVPRMYDLRDSGIIEQEADQILMLYRPSMDDENANAPDEIIIEKNRHGKTGSMIVNYRKEFAMWEDNLY
jgi:replicative DNA helicase